MQRTRSVRGNVVRFESDPEKRRTAHLRLMMRRHDIDGIAHELERNPEYVDHALRLVRDRRGTHIRITATIALAHVMEEQIRTGTIFDVFNAVIKEGPEDSVYDRHLKSTVVLGLVSFYILTHEEARIIELCEHPSPLVREAALGRILFYHQIEEGDIGPFVPTLEKALTDGIEIVHRILVERYIQEINYEGLALMLKNQNREIRYQTLIKLLIAREKGFDISPLSEDMQNVQKEFCCL